MQSQGLVPSVPLDTVKQYHAGVSVLWCRMPICDWIIPSFYETFALFVRQASERRTSACSINAWCSLVCCGWRFRRLPCCVYTNWQPVQLVSEIWRRSSAWLHLQGIHRFRSVIVVTRKPSLKVTPWTLAQKTWLLKTCNAIMCIHNIHHIGLTVKVPYFVSRSIDGISISPFLSLLVIIVISL